jgi:photosystem II stability/assembly factor-like uncharacterized protein
MESRMHASTLLLPLAIVACKGDPAKTAASDMQPGDHDTAEVTVQPWAWTPAGAVPGTRARALATVGTDLLAATDAGLHRSTDGGDTWNAVDAEGLPEGELVFLGAAGGEAVLGFVHGAGLLRSVDGGTTWASVARPPVQPLISALNPRGRVVPQATAVADDGTVWMAAVGGLHSSDDAGDTWVLTDLSSTSGSLNLLFTGVSVEGDEVVAVAQLADGMLPASYQGLLSGTVFWSGDGGATWTERGDGLGAHAPMAVAHGDDGVCVASMDRGVGCSTDGGATWAPLPDGPRDAVTLTALPDGAWGVGTASRGAWAWDGAAWSQAGAGAVAAGAGRVALSTTGATLRLTEDGGTEPPEDAGGTVHIALSFHTNYYHSYRGDSPDDDGYGQDIRVIRTALDWLDAHPDARADWDIENHFSLDGWMATDSPDVLARIQDRVADGTDDVRIMSWNNGALAAQSREEFDASVSWAQASNDAAFARQVPGVQPQECMTSPEHLGWYAEHGVEWITLFYAANGFTALRQDVALSGSALHNPVTLQDPESGASLVWVPAWHHADVLDHGGLAAWAHQISAGVPGDSLLLIHFDADAESWENFGLELDALAPQLADGSVVHTTIQGYLDGHPPVETVDLQGDVADGTGDGFQSWAEKDINHRLYTAIAAARGQAAVAALLGAGDEGVEAALDDALGPRLLALSTTHFGLAAPTLHEDRVASAWAHAEDALEGAQAALALAEAAAPVPAGEIHLVNARESAGPALVDVTLEIPSEQWTNADELIIRAPDGAPLPWEARDRTVWPDHVRQTLSLVAEVDARGTTALTWAIEAGATPETGDLTVDDAPDLERLLPPFTACGDLPGEAAPGETLPPSVSVSGLLAEQPRLWTLPFCDGTGDVAIRQSRWAGLPGTVVAVDAVMGVATDPTEAESVALTPLACDGHASALSWRTHGGADRTRPVRAGVSSWNGQAADGQVTLHCDDGGDLQIAHRVPIRTSMAFAPIRDRGGRTLVAPLGTLWGDGPWHDGRHTGGSGLGESVTGLVGSQYRPAAADWSGQPIGYQLLVGEDVPAATLDLFAHPPMVRVARVTSGR